MNKAAYTRLVDNAIVYGKNKGGTVDHQDRLVSIHISELLGYRPPSS